jgi:KDO2-lipid IV(A) lauroyltransferase
MMPFGSARVVARPLAALAWRLGARRREITMRNLRLAFPDWSDAERLRVARASFHNLLTVFLELPMLRHLSDAGLRRRIRVENIELLGAIGSRGALLLSAHFGNWELLALGSAALSGVPFTIVAKEQRDYGQLSRMRTSRGNRLIPTHRAAREASGILRDGGVIAMLADQSAPGRDALVEMFGVPTYSFSAPARLALRYRPDIIAGFTVRDRDGNYTVRLMTIPHDDLPDNEEGARALTQRYVSLLEEAVRANPEQWVWQHRKWKSTPGVSYESNAKF